jgi:hypothetical protein
MFLRSDCETEVLPVTSGTRVTVFYDIFQPTYQSPRAPDQCYGGIPAALKAALDCPSLLPDGGVLAFGFQHKYPFAPPENSTIGNDIVHYLKGRDAEWMRAVDDAGLRSEVIAVYDTATTKYHREGDALVAYERRDFGASRNFHAIRGLYMDCSDDEAIVEFLAPGERVHWVTKPASWAIENTYAYYKCVSVVLFSWDCVFVLLFPQTETVRYSSKRHVLPLASLSGLDHLGIEAILGWYTRFDTEVKLSHYR